MKTEMKKTELILYIIITVLLAIILMGTIIGISKGHRPAENLRTTDPSPKEITSLNKKTSDKQAAFTDLGQIRAVTKTTESEDGVAVVLTPWLTYPEGDTVFFEELSRKRLVIKGIFNNFFSSYSQNELLKMTEPVIKERLLEEINEQLTLGKISAVYFSEYIFLQ